MIRAVHAVSATPPYSLDANRRRRFRDQGHGFDTTEIEECELTKCPAWGVDDSGSLETVMSLHFAILGAK